MSEDELFAHLTAVYAPIAALFFLGLSVGLRGRRANGSTPPAVEAPLSPPVGGYRTNPRPQPSLPRKTPWWRLALWWARGGPRRLRYAVQRRQWNGSMLRAERASSFGFRSGWKLPIVEGGQMPQPVCWTCGAIDDEPCDAGLHS